MYISVHLVEFSQTMHSYSKCLDQHRTFSAAQKHSPGQAVSPVRAQTFLLFSTVHNWNYVCSFVTSFQSALYLSDSIMQLCVVVDLLFSCLYFIVWIYYKLLILLLLSTWVVSSFGYCIINSVGMHVLKHNCPVLLEAVKE